MLRPRNLLLTAIYAALVPAAASAQGTADPPLPPVPDGPRPQHAVVKSGQIDARTKTLTLTVGCPADSAQPCSGSMVLKTLRAVRASPCSPRLPLTISRGSFAAVDPGTSESVEVPVSKRARRFVRSQRRIQVTSFVYNAAGSQSQAHFPFVSVRGKTVAMETCR